MGPDWRRCDPDQRLRLLPAVRRWKVARVVLLLEVALVRRRELAPRPRGRTRHVRHGEDAELLLLLLLFGTAWSRLTAAAAAAAGKPDCSEPSVGGPGASSAAAAAAAAAAGAPPRASSSNGRCFRHRITTPPKGRRPEPGCYRFRRFLL